MSREIKHQQARREQVRREQVRHEMEQEAEKLDLTRNDKPHGMRATRYVYHIHGHAMLHGAERQAIPFETVIRRPFAIDSDKAMDEVRQEVRGELVEQLAAQDSPYIVGDVMIRGVSKLHRILVEADDPDGPAARIMS